MYPAVKARESVGRFTTPTMTPQKVVTHKRHKVFNKAVYRRLFNELNYKTTIFCFEMKVFIHGISICEGVSEGSGFWNDM